MKYLLLSLMILAAGINLQAQPKAVNPTNNEHTMDAKTSFINSANIFEASSNRKARHLYEAEFIKLNTAMGAEIDKTKSSISTLKGSAKKEAQKKYDAETALYEEIKQLSSTLPTNSGIITTKLKEFANFL